MPAQGTGQQKIPLLGYVQSFTCFQRDAKSQGTSEAKSQSSLIKNIMKLIKTFDFYLDKTNLTYESYLSALIMRATSISVTSQGQEPMKTRSMCLVATCHM